MTRGGLWLAAALLAIAPLDARSDEASGETMVIQDASGRIVVVPAKPAASATQSAPKRVVPAKRPPSAARVPAAPAQEPAAAPARDGIDACRANGDLVASWQAARKRVVEATEELEAAESIPLTGMSGYRDARIAAAERQLEKAETRESEIDTTARNLGVPPRCFED